jgi:hypothetical protein
MISPPRSSIIVPIALIGAARNCGSSVPPRPTAIRRTCVVYGTPVRDLKWFPPDRGEHRQAGTPEARSRCVTSTGISPEHAAAGRDRRTTRRQLAAMPAGDTTPPRQRPVQPLAPRNACQDQPDSPCGLLGKAPLSGSG